MGLSDNSQLKKVCIDSRSINPRQGDWGGGSNIPLPFVAQDGDQYNDTPEIWGEKLILVTMMA